MRQNPHEEPTTYHRPEFVILEDDNKDSDQRGQDQYQTIFKNLKNLQTTPLVHIMAFVVFLFTFVLALASFLFFSISLLFAALGFFKNEQLNQAAGKSWKNLKKIMVSCLGLAIAVFSPSLGFGLIFLYFVFKKEPIDPRFMNRFMKAPKSKE